VRVNPVGVHLAAWQAAILGVVQGLTEFLPVSSSGHLVLARGLLGVQTDGVVFEVIVHVATLCAVLWVYRVRVASLVRGMIHGRPESWRYVGLLALASVPAGIVGVAWESEIEGLFGRPPVAAALLLVTGVAVWTVGRTSPRARDPEPGAGQAMWVGIAQAAAILPGLSRSGMTLAAGSWRGVEVVALAEFSFLMSVPAIGGAALLKASDIGGALSSGALVPLAVGFGCSLAAGVFAIRFFLRTLERRTFHRFSYYCWALGLSYLLLFVVRPGLVG